MTYSCTILMPLSCSSSRQPSVKHSKITGDNANCRFYFKVSSLSFPVKGYLQVRRGLMQDFPRPVLILELTSPRRVTFTMSLSFDWNCFKPRCVFNSISSNQNRTHLLSFHFYKFRNFILLRK